MEWEIVEKKDYKKYDLQLQKKYVTLFLKWRKNVSMFFRKVLFTCITVVQESLKFLFKNRRRGTSTIIYWLQLSTFFQ